jgi:hypothetical protein
MPKVNKNVHLDYAEGPREQYGEGTRYRKEDLTKGADTANSHDGFAGGDRPSRPVPNPRLPQGD